MLLGVMSSGFFSTKNSNNYIVICVHLVSVLFVLVFGFYKLLFAFSNQLFQGFNMFLKLSFSKFCSAVSRIWLSPDKLLFHFNIGNLFQRFGMTRQVAIRDRKQFFQGLKIGILIHHQNRHNAQSNSVIKCFIYVIYYAQNYFAVRSKRIYINPP